MRTRTLAVSGLCMYIIFGWMMKNMGRTVKYMAPLTFLIGYALFAMGVATPLLYV